MNSDDNIPTDEIYFNELVSAFTEGVKDETIHIKTQ